MQKFDSSIYLTETISISIIYQLQLIYSETKIMKSYCCKKHNKELDELKSFLNVISDKNRLRIICTLKKKERCVCEVYEDLDLSQNLTSHHLRLLEKAGIVSWRKEGVKVFYKINEEKLKQKLGLLYKFLNT